MPVLVLLVIFLGVPAWAPHGAAVAPARAVWVAGLWAPRVVLVPSSGRTRAALVAPAGPVALAGPLRAVLVAPAVPVAPAGPPRSEPGASYAWPLAPPTRVVRAFAPPAEPWLPGHRGVDLAAAPGTVVGAAGAGRVVYAGELAGRGVVSVQHPDGLRTTYEPVTPSVAVGDAVTLGSPLGVLEPAHPGCREAACLHWGLRRGDLYLDPLALLGLGRVRLLPVPASP